MARREDLPEMDAVGQWLGARIPGRPRRPAIVHGDYKLDNVMLDGATRAKVSAVLDWEACTSQAGKARLDLVTRLLAVRRREIVPRIPQAAFGTAQVAGHVLEAEWRLSDGGKLFLVANLGTDPAALAGRVTGTPIWGGPAPQTLPPYAVFWSVGAP